MQVCRNLLELRSAHRASLARTNILRRRAVELVHPKRRAVKIPDVAEVIKLMQNSPTAAFLRGCSLHERLMLAALVKCVKREGVEEIRWGEVR